MYAEVLDAFGTERTVVIRTLDAGSDKPIAFATHEGEENPRSACAASGSPSATRVCSSASSPASPPRRGRPPPTRG